MGGESHSGLTRPACGRVEEMYEIGIPIRNTRQVTVLSSEELEAIAQEMGVGDLPPGLLGANVVITGIPAFTLVPPGSRLQFNRGVTLTVDFENLPCNLPAREIEAEMPGFGKKFKAAAANRRGVTAWVERVGTVELGESARIVCAGPTALASRYAASTFPGSAGICRSSSSMIDSAAELAVPISGIFEANRSLKPCSGRAEACRRQYPPKPELDIRESIGESEVAGGGRSWIERGPKRPCRVVD